MDLNKTGEFIATRRKLKNMTQKELAENIGITDKAVSRWETGKGFPDVSLLTALADSLDTTVSELVMGEITETEEKSAAITNKAVVSALDYSRREVSKFVFWRNVSVIALCGFTLAVLPGSTFLQYMVYSDNVSDLIYTMLMFFIIPVGLPVILSGLIRKPIFLWASPIIVLLLALLVRWAFHPTFFYELFDSYQDGSRTRTHTIIFCIPFLTSILTAAICSSIKGLRARKEGSQRYK